MVFELLPFLARKRGIGRAIRNLYDGVMAGDPWAITIAVGLGIAVVAAVGYYGYRAVKDAENPSEDVEMTAEEKNLMNKF